MESVADNFTDSTMQIWAQIVGHQHDFGLSKFKEDASKCYPGIEKENILYHGLNLLLNKGSSLNFEPSMFYNIENWNDKIDEKEMKRYADHFLSSKKYTEAAIGYARLLGLSDSVGIETKSNFILFLSLCNL